MERGARTPRGRWRASRPRRTSQKRGEVQASKLIHKMMPVYPASAKAAGVQGTVILHAVVGMDGRPLSLRAVNDDIDRELARAAIEAVSQWR